MANTRAVIDIDINTSGAASALKSLQSQINAFTTALNRNNAEQALASRGISRQLMDLVNTSRFFTAEMTKMQTGAAQLDKTLSKGQVTMGQFFSQKFRKDGLAAAQVLSLANARASALQTQFVATAGAAGGMREALAIRPLQAFNTEAAVTAQRLAIQRAMLQQATTSMINFGKNTQWAGRQLMVGFTVPMTIFAATAGKAFMEIDKELTNFKKVYGDAMTPPAELEQNLAAVQGLAKEFTKYGIAVKDTIGLAAQAAAAGAQNADLIDATTQSTRLATLGQMEQNEALETTISLQNAFKLSGDELSKSINFLNMVENQTVVTLQDLSAAIPRVAPVIKGLGGSVEDLAAMLAAMQEGGVSAEQGANALKSGLASLINPTNRASEGLEKVGINLNAIINTNRGDLMGTVQDFADALDTLDKFSRQQALEQVFGKFQYARLGALFDNINKDGTQAARVLDLANMSAQQLAASAEKELGAIEQSVSVKFTAAMEKIKADIAPIGELFLKMATPIINFLSSVIEKFNSLPDFAKNFAAFGSVIVGVVIPAGTMFLGLLMNLVGTLTKFSHLSTIFVKGFASGGIRKAISNVTQAVSYMSLTEIDATLAAEQLSGATNSVNAALLDQVAASEPATAAILELAAAYDILAQNMRESAAAAPVVLGPAGQAMRRGSGSIVGRPLPIVARNKGGSIPYLSGGGRPTVPGMGTKDTVPAMLTPGEFVVNKKATEQNMALLHAINDGDVQYRNMGGGIAKPGRKYYGIKPNSLSIHTQRAKERLAAFESSRSDIAGIFGVSPTVRRAPVMRSQQSTKVAGSKSADIYKALEGRSTANAELLRTAVALGISPEELGLKKLGNLIVGTSKSTNMLMATGNLSKSQLLGDVSGAKSLSPISAQLERYFGSKLDEKVFRRLYLQEIDKLPSQGITNKRFEKATRNALRRYLDESGYNKNQRNSFIRDILEGDTVRSGASLSRVKQALDSNGISYTQEDGKLWATVNGKTYDFARLTGKKIDNLGRVEGIIRYDKIPMEEGLARAHANKGGMIGGVQYFRFGGLPQAIKSMAGLFSTRTGLPGVSRGRASLNKRFLKTSSEMGIETPSSGINLEGSLTGAGKQGALIEGLSLQRGHVASARRSGDVSYHPGLMFWQGKEVNRGLVSKGLTGKQIVEDFLKIEKSGLHPASLMMVGGQELGLTSTELKQIQVAYNKIIKGLSSKKNSSRIFKDEDFTSYTESILRRTLDKKTFDAFYNVGTVRSSGKSIATTSFDNFMSSTAVKRNNGGIIPMLNKGGGPLFLGMPRSFNPRNKEIRDALRRSTVQATTGRFASMPVTEVGSMVQGIGGRSSTIPGINGIYELNGRRSVVKIHETAESALAEARSSQLMSGMFGLVSPKQELIKMRHPQTGDIIFGVRSPYDPRIANPTGKIEKGSFADQLIASAIRRDSDLQPDNIFGSVVADSGASIFGMNTAGKPRASQPRIIGDTPIPVTEQLDINLLRTKGGAKKFFAESSADIARTMTADEYENIILGTIKNAKSRAVTAIDSLPDLTAKERETYLRTIVKDLDDLSAVDWKKIHDHHVSVVPQVKKPPTPAAIKKAEEAAIRKEQEEALRIRQRGHAQGMPYGISWLNNGGMIPRFNMGGQAFESGGRPIVPGVGNRDTVPAMLTPGEFVINKKATQENLPLLHAINGGKVNNYSIGGMAKGIQKFILGGLVRGVSAAGGGLWQYTDLTGQRVLAGSLEEANKAQRKVNREITRAQRENNRRQRQQSRSQSGGMGRGFGLSMGIGAAGGALMSAQMIPGVAENPGLSGAMQAGGMALSMASILPMIPGAMNPYVLAVGAAAAVTAGSLYAWRKSVDENAKKSAELGAAVGGTANSLNVMAKVLGTQTPAMAQATQTLNIAADDMAQFEEIGTYLQGEAGQEFLSRFEGKTTVQRTTELTDYITQAVAAGMMDNASAELFAKAVGQSLGDVTTGSAAAANIKDAKAGIDAMLDLADKRLSAVEKTAAISEVAKAPEIGDFGFQKSIATEASAFAIGSALQVVQDYSNVIAQARNEYENGTISHRKYIEVLNKATSAQDEYASVISKSVANAVDMQGARQALDAQLIAGGMTQEQVDAITSSTDIGVSGAIQLPFLGGGQGGQSAYISDYLSRATEGTFSYDMANADELIAEAQRAQDAASKMFENGLNEDLKTMVAAGKIAADQAAALGRELMNNSLSAAAQQYQKMQEEGKSLLGLDQAVFMQNIESGIIAGLDDIQEQKIIDIGVRYSETGGNLAELTASLNNLPDDKRLNFITSLSGDIDEELLDILLKGSAEALTTKVSLFAAGLDSGYRSDVSASGLAKDVVVNRALGTTANVETTNRQEANRANALMNSSDAQRRQNLGIDKLKQQSEEYITAFDKIAEMAGAEAAIAIDTQLKFNGNQEDLPRVIDGIKEYEENIKNLTDLPKDISVRLNVDYSDPDQVNNLGPLAETIKTNWPILQNLNKSIDLKLYSEFLLTNGRGEELSAKEIFANTKELNRLENTFKNAKNSTVRKQAFLELIQRKNGKLDDAGIDQAGDIWQDMINKFGNGVITKAKPDVLIKYYDIQVEISGLKEAKQKMQDTFDLYISQGITPPTSLIVGLGKINSLIKSSKNKAKEAEAKIYGSSMGPSTTGGGGGGGGGQKSIIQQLKEQFNTLKDIFDSMSQFINSKTGQFKGIIAGPFGPEFIEYLKSQGEQGIKILKNGGEKLKEAYKEFRKVQTQEAANFAQTFPATIIRQRKNIQIESAFRGKLESRGFDTETQDQFIEGIGGVEGIRAYNALVNKRNELKKKGKDLSKEELNQLKAINSAMKLGGPAAKELFSSMTKEDVRKNLSEMTKETKILAMLLSQGYTKEEAEQLKQMGVNTSMTADEIKILSNNIKDLTAQTADVRELSMELLNIQGQQLSNDEDIKQLEYEIKLIENVNKNEKIAALYAKEKVSNQEDLLAVYERQANIKAREIELEQRKLEPIDDQIDQLEKQKDAIDKSYEERLEILDDISKKEEEIYAIRARRLDVASALSRGDVAGAVQAANELARESAARRIEDQRSAIEKQRQLEIESIDSKINDLKTEREVIENNIKRLQIEQRNIQDEIYDIQFAISEEAFKLQNEYGIGNSQLDILKNRLALALIEQEKLRESAEKTANALERAKSAQGGGGGGSGTTVTAPQQATGVPGTISQGDIGTITYDSNGLGWATLPGFGITVPAYALGGSVNYKGSRERAPGMMYGGKLMKFANGSFVPGVGMTDKVPALLTPGEFVVRKSVAREYGPFLESLNSQVNPKFWSSRQKINGFNPMSLANPTMNVSISDVKYQMPAVSTSAMYSTRDLSSVNTDVKSNIVNNITPTTLQYNYNINVNAETNASADSIADAVLYKIQRIESRNVGGTRIG